MTWTTRQRSEVKGLAAIRRGAGPRVVLLHGVGLRAEAWNRQIDALAERYDVTAFDMAGHGQSAIPKERMSLADYSDAVLAALDEPALIVGHSMGAMIALDIANRHPEKVSGVAALNGIFERSAQAASAVRTRAAELDGQTRADPSTTLERWFGETRSPERDACQDWLNEIDPASYKMAYTAFAESDGPSKEALTQLACPALFITGEREPNSTPVMSRAMANLAPIGEALIIDEAAHMMPMTHANAVNTALQEFAKDVTA